MSLTATQTSTVVFPGTRKRTSSFCCSLQLSSNPRPAKVPRLSKSMGATLRRTETYLCLSDAASTSSKSTSTPMTAVKTASPSQNVSPISKKREQKVKERRKASVADVPDESESHSIRLSTQTSPRQKSTAIRPFVPQLSKTVAPLTPAPLPIHRPSQPSSSQRTATSSSTIKCRTPVIVTPPTSLSTAVRRSSPLSPSSEPRASRPQFPRSKPEPDLYKKALKTCMKSSPEGQKILRMGPRLAISIMTATRELEKIVAAQEQREKEIADDAMAVDSHPVLSKSWVVIPDQDWEMVDCSA